MVAASDIFHRSPRVHSTIALARILQNKIEKFKFTLLLAVTRNSRFTMASNLIKSQLLLFIKKILDREIRSILYECNIG
jgi:hypothetical protein